MTDGLWPPLPDPNPTCIEPLTPEDDGRKAGLLEELRPVTGMLTNQAFMFLCRLIIAGHNVYAAEKSDPQGYHIYWHQRVDPFPFQGPPREWQEAYFTYIEMLTRPRKEAK